MSPEETCYTVIVVSIVSGKHGPYGVARFNLHDSITFSLKHPVWQAESLPVPGDTVVLGGVRKKRAGWYATSARFLTPDDAAAS